MLRDILRFYKQARAYAKQDQFKSMSLGQLLYSEGYSDVFIKKHLAPMGAAIWSSDNDSILHYPAISFLRFFNNHGLTQLSARPSWRTVEGGSRAYVKRLASDIETRGTILPSTPVTAVTAIQNGACLTLATGAEHCFEHVVFACHSDQAAALLQNAPRQRQTLSRLRYSQNKVVLHTDTALMPKRRQAWASWNYIENGSKNTKPAVSYWMNRLQKLPVETPVIATLNPHHHVTPEKILGTYHYDHPVFDHTAIAAKNAVWEFQGLQNFWFCGAYLGDGFHEDGIQAGLAVAEILGGQRRPWHKAGQNSRIGFPDKLPLVHEAA